MGALLGNPFVFKGDATDVDAITEAGLYGVNATGGPMTKNSPFNLGLILALNGKGNYAGGGNPMAKIGIPNTGRELYVKTRWLNSWYPWMKLTLVAVE